MIDWRKLIEGGVPYGHLTSRWCPKMKPFIWGAKGGIHLHDVAKTAHQLERAKQFLEKLSSEGKSVLWVGTKKAAQQVIEEVGKDLQMPYVTHRWVGGTVSNFSQVKKSVTKLLHLEDVAKKDDKSTAHYTKKELVNIQKMIARLNRSVGGLRKLVWPVGAIVIVDVLKEEAAVKEARAMGIPIIALVDTNGDPSLVDYVIPSNDDATKSIKLIIDYLADAVRTGKSVASPVDHTVAVAQVAESLIDPITQEVAVAEFAIETDDEAPETEEKKKPVKRVASGQKNTAPFQKRAFKKKDEE